MDRPGARIVLVIGAGHASILRHLFDSSLYFDVVDAAEVLGYGTAP